ncbi:S8 family serine peptidase [Dokdonella sp.]|uniref:S8 family serine peptidase n=1 Tax=Dokdonella sp. TaxID=2291710 RepID=UPI001B1E2632|nr:S8 family serine peptidase [Dokdonella sp.]MBO9664585.1 S8 family serine peptidase [Dokdonella sp.]
MLNLPARTALAAALAVALSAGAPVASIAAETVAAAAPSIEAIEAARANPNLIILRSGVLNPATQQLDASAVGAAPDAPSAYAIVQFQPGQLRQQKALAASGVQFLGYVPNNAYYVRLNGHGIEALKAHPGVRWAGTLQPAMKLDPQLWTAKRLASAAKQEGGSYEIIVHAFNGVSSANIAESLRKAVPSVTITARSERAEATPYVRAEVDAANLDALVRAATAVDGVSYVMPWIQPRTMNSGSVGAIQGNSTAACAGSGVICGPSPIWDHGLTGSGQIVAVADSGTTPNAAWFATLDKGTGPHTEVTFADNPAPTLPNIGALYPDNKIIAYWTQPGGAVDYDYTSGHGTHTTGTVVGDAAGTFGASTYVASTPALPNHELADGMAPNAQLLMQDIGGTSPTAVIVTDFQGTLEQAHAGGARLHNNSWGAPTAGQYTGNDADLDHITRRHEDLLVIVSAGNDDPGPTQTGSPSNAKNALSVAALNHAGSTAHASYSNLGPAADGRAKPDIAAPGSSVVSARNSTSATPVTSTVLAPQTRSISGTSMAAPTLTGNAALMRQYFSEGFYPRGEETAADPHNPTGALMKAVLLNGTNPLVSTTWPTVENGWGRAWLDGNLWFKNTMPGGDDSRRLRLFERTNAAGLETGDVNEYTIANVAAGVELRATLTWFDVDAAPGVASALINDLDLEVVGPGGTYLGNHFASGVSTPGGSANAKDTVEQVRLTTPVAGSYTFRVKAANVPGDGSSGSDRQGYALAVSGAFGMPDSAAFPAPTALSAASNGTGGIGIGFTGAAGAQSFQLYRADGTCASAAAGDFHLVAAGAASPLVDTRTQGGYSYAYKVRGVQNDVEGEISACFNVVSQDECTLLPSFDTHSLVADGANSSCSVDLNWAAATSQCPAATDIQYTVLRDTDPYFGAPTTLTSALTATTFADTGVTNGTPYFYRVFAKDSTGNTSVVSSTVAATPSGVDGPDPAAFLDDVDTHAYMTMQAPWQITDTAASAGTFSYHNAADGALYPAGACASIETPALTLPANASLSYKAQYNIEYQWDGAVTEISTDGGATWNDLPPTGGYPSSFAQTQGNGCNFPTSRRAFNGVSTASNAADPNNDTATPVFRSFGSDLASYAGQTVKIRWRFSSDGGAEYSGFWLDEVSIGNGGPTDVIFANGFEQASGSGGEYMCH